MFITVRLESYYNEDLKPKCSRYEFTSKQHYIINQCKAYDISFLYETKLMLSNRVFLKAKWGNEMVYMAATNTARRGVITLVHAQCAAILNTEVADDVDLLRIRDKNYLLCNVYGDPTSDAEAHNTFTKINDKMEEIKTQYPIDHYILGGDYNLCLERRDSTSSSRKPRAEGQLITILNSFNLHNAAALLHHVPKHTYFLARHENISFLC